MTRIDPTGIVYTVTIIRRDFQGQTRHDFHATVVRNYDKKEVWIISSFLWLLKWKTRRKALDRTYRRIGIEERKAAQKETFTR